MNVFVHDHRAGKSWVYSRYCLYLFLSSLFYNWSVVIRHDTSLNSITKEPYNGIILNFEVHYVLQGKAVNRSQYHWQMGFIKITVSESYGTEVYGRKDDNFLLHLEPIVVFFLFQEVRNKPRASHGYRNTIWNPIVDIGLQSSVTGGLTGDPYEKVKENWRGTQ
jgi:hypothetical protein